MEIYFYGRGGNNYRHAVEIIMGAVEIIIATRWKYIFMGAVEIIIATRWK